MDLTQILRQAQSGDAAARAELIQAAYDDLRKMAAGKMAGEKINHTLTSTALVHEVSLKMLADSRLPGENRGQFFAYASKAMRHFLIDYARTKGRQKRGGDRRRYSFDDVVVACEEQRDDLLELNAALESLAEVSPRKAEIVEMRYFGGLTIPEISQALGIAPATVKREWSVAKTWLLKELRDDEPGPRSRSQSEETP